MKRIGLAVGLLLFAGSAFAGDISTETTQLLNKAFLLREADAVEAQLAIVEQMSKLNSDNVMDALGLSNALSKIKTIVSRTVNLYDSLENVTDIIENSYKTYEKNLSTLGFSNVKEFSYACKINYLNDLLKEMQRGAAALENLDDVNTSYKDALSKIKSADSYRDIMTMSANVLNETRLQLGQISTGIEMLSTAEAQARAVQLQIETEKELKDQVQEEILNDTTQKYEKVTPTTPSSWTL